MARRELEVGEEFTGTALRWFQRLSCDCGHAFEDKGDGVPMPFMRRALMEKLGRSEVWVDDAEAVPGVVAILTAGFGLTAAEAKQKLASLPAVAFEGTHLEAAHVHALLEHGGVKARVVSYLEPAART